jgi:hypothetical protein
MVACVPIHISRQRNALAIALTIALSIRRLGGTQVSIVPSGTRTSFRPPRPRIEGRSPFCEVLWNFAPTRPQLCMTRRSTEWPTGKEQARLFARTAPQ